MWILSAPEATTRLVLRWGWSWDRYEAWPAEAMADALVGPAPSPASQRSSPPR